MSEIVEQREKKGSINIVNVVMSCNFRHPIDLLSLGQHIEVSSLKQHIDSISDQPSARYQAWPPQAEPVKEQIDSSKKQIFSHLSYRYNVEQFPGAILRMDRSQMLVFASGKCVCTSSRVKTGKAVIRKITAYLMLEGLLPKGCKPEVSTTNVVASASIGKNIECGLVQTVFPDAVSSRFGGGCTLVRIYGGVIRVFNNGKMIAIGYKTEESAVHTLETVMDSIEQNKNRNQIDRLTLCKLERYDPSLKEYKELVGKYHFSDEDKIYGEDLLEKYLKKVQEGSMGMDPRTLACAIVYLLGNLQNKPITQNRIARDMSIAEVTVRNGYFKVMEALDMISIVNVSLGRDRFDLFPCNDCLYYPEIKENYCKLGRRHVLHYRSYENCGTFRDKITKKKKVEKK